jgi:hypothetical protein
MDIYRERAYLLSLLSTQYPSHLYVDPDGEPGFGVVVSMSFLTGQANWHISESDLDLFDHLDRFAHSNWDGHSTEEKYQRIAALVRENPREWKTRG